MPKPLIGTAPDQVPTNAMLGRLAHMSRVPGTQRGDIILVDTTVTSAVATISFAKDINTLYSAFQLEWYGLVPSAAANLGWRVSADAGATWDSGANNYYFGLNRVDSSGGSAYGTSGTAGQLNGMQNVSATASHGGSSGRLTLWAPAVAGAFHTVTHEVVDGAGAALVTSAFGGGVRVSTSAINGIQLLWLSGANFVSGRVVLKGIV